MVRPAIDLVYTWVNGGDPDYQAQCRRYAGASSDLNPERYRDTYATLKYSLRSVEKYTPWIRNIYLLTARPQRPEWLNVDHPYIHLIHHDEIIDDTFLPTFNSHTIESYLHRIPSPSDYLLYVCDDFLFGRPVEQTEYLTEDGRIRLHGTLFGERLKFRICNRLPRLFSFGFMEHIPVFIYKPFWENMLSFFGEAVERTRRHKFRDERDVWMDRLYRYYALKHHRAGTQVVPAYELLTYHRFHKIVNHYGRQEKGIRRLQRIRPKFYCLNDDQGAHPDEQVVQLISRFLDEYYPDKSSFEI